MLLVVEQNQIQCCGSAEPQPPGLPCAAGAEQPAYHAEAGRTARLRRSLVIRQTSNSSTAIVNQKTLDTTRAPTPGLPFCQGEDASPNPKRARRAQPWALDDGGHERERQRTRSRPKSALHVWEKGRPGAAVAVRLPQAHPHRVGASRSRE